MSDKVTIFDTTLRDGEQSAGVLFREADKVEIAERLLALGVDVIEAGFPAASPSEFAAVRRIAENLKGVQVCGLARAVEADIMAACESLARAETSRVHVFINSSDMQLAQQLNKSREQVLEIARASVALARKHAAAVEFSPMDATRADPEFLASLVRTAIAAGADVINIPDTVGYTLPAQLAELIRDLYKRVPELRERVLSFHGQDDLGLATANALTAVTEGARQVEVTINGIGERAGNTSLEEVVIALKVHGKRLGVHTDLKTEEIYPLSKLIEQKSGLLVPPNKAVVGRNAFRHASGIHQDGVLKQRDTYEVIDPAWVGHPEGTRIILGKLSGRAGVASRAKVLGCELRGAELARVYEVFQRVADERTEVQDDELLAICKAVLRPAP
ncbi:MAG TPA: 2-isopropylmalate synthase [Polyangiales bacterium]|jgi:2-isopropylmalate synthase|nr:2-isopropylmalate synthase [Polyangiales bacterium]